MTPFFSPIAGDMADNLTKKDSITREKPSKFIQPKFYVTPRGLPTRESICKLSFDEEWTV
jgi:hypothetical protein